MALVSADPEPSEAAAGPTGDGESAGAPAEREGPLAAEGSGPSRRRAGVDVEAAGRHLGHAFCSPEVLVEALTHASAASHHLGSNERLEFLGDAVLELVVCHRLFELHPDLREGDLTTMKSSLVSRRTCGQIARETGLVEHLVVGKGIVGRRQIPASLAANVYESVVAALYLDGGFEVAKRYVLKTMGPLIDALGGEDHAHNYKAMLQQHAQKFLDASPQYELLDEKGPDHSKCFEVGVVIDAERFEPAWGPNKKSAEQKAAIAALWELEVLDDDERAAAVEAIDALMPQELD